MLVEGKVKQAASALARLGLTLDSWLYHPQLDEVSELADALQNLTIVLNHVGNPILGGPYRGLSDEVFADWRERIRQVGARENVYINLGALCRSHARFPRRPKLAAAGSTEVVVAWSP